MWQSFLESGVKINYYNWKIEREDGKKEKFGETENDRNMIFGRTRETKLKSNV